MTEEEDYQEWAEHWIQRIDELKSRLQEDQISQEEKEKIYEEFPGLHPNWPKNLPDDDLLLMRDLSENLTVAQLQNVEEEIKNRGEKI